MTAGEFGALLVLIILMAGIVFGIGFTAGVYQGRVWEKRVAVRAGVGRLAADPKTGEIRFLYGAKR